jgi:ABC-type multidrug transport system ATPase subunit
VAQDKILLNNVTARANHSEMLAVVGPSGSSKTTFLDAMAGRIDRRSLSGEILVNQSPMDATFKRVSGYVMQVCALSNELLSEMLILLNFESCWALQDRTSHVSSCSYEVGRLNFLLEFPCYSYEAGCC